jgi:signal transduction histidine kinase
LAIVHNVVTSALKGRVELTSERGRGTAVTVTIPKTVEEGPGDEVPGEEPFARGLS